MNRVASGFVVTLLFSLPSMTHANRDRQDGAAPVPDAGSRKKAETLIRGVFKEEYSNKSRAGRRALANLLIEQGIRTRHDEAARFVLFREARDISANDGDAATAARAVDEMAARFEINAMSMKLGAFQKAGKKSKTPSLAKALTRAYFELAEAAATAGDYDTAAKAARAAEPIARRSRDLQLATKAKAKARDFADILKQFQPVKAALKTLSSTPDDARANLVAGRFVCMFEGNWERGLPLLKKCSDPALKALAESDMRGSEDAAGEARIGDGWWDRGERETGIARQNLRARAAVWYTEAISGLSGLRKTRIERRLETVIIRPTPRTRESWVNVTDAERFGVEGDPGESIVIVAPFSGTSVHMLREFPTGNFDGVSARIRVGRNKAVHGILVFEKGGRCVMVDAALDKFEAEHFVDGEWVSDTHTECPRRESYVVTVVIQNGEYVASLDGKEMLRVKTAADRITFLALKADLGRVVFDRIKLRKKR